MINGLGEFFFSIAADERTGVIDMYAGPTKDAMAVFPTRVVALSDGHTAYSFTMFQARRCPTSCLTRSTRRCGVSSRTSSGCSISKRSVRRAPRR